MAKSFKDALEDQRNTLKYEQASAKRIRDWAKTHNVGELFTALVAAEPRCTMYVGIYSIGIEIPVLSMKHMLEVCEHAERVLGIELDQTDDNAAGGTRTFYAKNDYTNPIRITARVPLSKEEGQTCERVQVGVKTVEVPEYQLVCD